MHPYPLIQFVMYAYLPYELLGSSECKVAVPLLVDVTFSTSQQIEQNSSTLPAHNDTSRIAYDRWAEIAPCASTDC